MQKGTVNLSQKHLVLEGNPMQEWLNSQKKTSSYANLNDNVDQEQEHHCHIMGKSNLQMAISAGSIVENNYSEVRFSNDYQWDHSKEERSIGC